MSRAAPFAGAVAAQVAVEARLTIRRGENLLAMIGLPVAALWFFGTLGVGDGRSVDSLVASVLAIALVASGLVNVAIATGFERGYGVLKRLGGSPLGRQGLIAAKIGVVGAVAVLQVVALLALALAIGWRPDPAASALGVLLTLIVGSGTFASLGLLIAGTFRPEATLVVANVLFLIALPLGGVLGPVGELPAPLTTLALALPVGSLSEAFRAAMVGGTGYAPNLVVVAAWGVAAAILTIRSFRWE